MIRKVPSYESPAQSLPFATFEWNTIWNEIIGIEWELYFLDGNDDVIAPFARRGNDVIFAGGDEVADYLDIVGENEAKERCWPEILEFLKQDGVTSLHLNNVPQDSRTVAFFKSKSSVMKEEDTTPITSLPPVLDKKNRHEMERKIRKFEREHANIKISEGNDIRVLFSLMKLDERKKIFLTPDMEEFFRRIAQKFGKLTVLTVQDKPAACMLTFAAGDTLMGYNSGFDEANYSGSGFYLKAKMLDRALDAGYKKFNFLQGNERYKYELGGKDFFVYKIDIKI